MGSGADLLLQLVDSSPQIVALTNEASGLSLPTPLLGSSASFKALARKIRETEDQLLSRITEFVARNPTTQKYLTCGAEYLSVTRQIVPLSADSNAVIFTLQSVTDLVTTKAALEASETKLTQIADLSREFFWELDAEFRFTYAHYQIEWALGVPANEIVGRSLFDFVQKDEAERLRDALKECQDSGNPIRDYLCTFLGEGNCESILQISAIPKISPEGIEIGFLGTSLDMTVQIEAERRSRRILDLLHHAERMAKVGAWEWNLETGSVFWTDELYHIHGMTPDDQTCFDKAISFYPQPGRGQLEAALASCIASGKPYNIELPIETAKGNRIWLRSMGTPIYRDGKVVALRGAAQDVTDILVSQSQLEEARIRAESASRAKSEFLANMSHEIRTPMNGVLGMGELLLHTPLNNEQRDLLQSLLDSGRSMIHVVNDVLDFSKIEAGRLDLAIEPFAPSELLHTTQVLFQADANKRGISLVPISRDLPQYLYGDSARLQQILINLVGNAMKFTPSGGTVEVMVEYQEQNLVLSVKDTGIGISPEKQTHIFEPFSQEDASISRRFGGTGLGLSITTRLVSLMDGVVKLDSIPGKGSTFTVKIPCRQSEHGPQRSTRRVRMQDFSSSAHLNILVAEDNLVNQKLIATLLQRAGHTVTIAHNGQQAVDLHRQEQFDLILMDVHMPELDGEEATRMIRTGNVFPTIPIIAVTANALVGDRERLLNLGMDGYLAKPISAKELLTLIQTFGLPSDRSQCTESAENK